MKRETIVKYIHELGAMIATFQQATVIDGRSQKESEACELLKDARLKLIEDLEQRLDYLAQEDAEHIRHAYGAESEE